MTADDILLEAERLGITLTLRDRKIVAQPLSAATPALAAAIRANKRRLAARLREREVQLLFDAKLVQLTLPAREAQDVDESTEAERLILDTCQRLSIALWLDAEGHLVVGRIGTNGQPPAIPSGLSKAIAAHAGRIIDILRTHGPLPPPPEPEFRPNKPTAGRLRNGWGRPALNEFNRCDICWDPAAIINQYGRFCGLKCFRVWQGMPADEVLTDAVTLDPAIEAELARIWPEAERLRWSHERIWNVHFWPNTTEHPRGLAAVLQPGDTIQPCDVVIEVTRDYIGIERTEVHFVKADSVITRHERKYQFRFPRILGTIPENRPEKEQEQPKTAQPPLKTEPGRTDATFELTQLREAEIDRPAAGGNRPPPATGVNLMEHFTRIPDFTTLGRFGVIYADPPWSYRDLGHTRRIDRQYPILSVRDIAALPVQDIALPDAVLFLWIPVPLLPDGLTVMKAWRFDYKSNLVWDKEIFGMGHYARIQHEHLLLGTSGKPGTSADHGISSVIRERRGKHSVKPAEVYRLIERMYPALPKIELFARNCRPGWTSWGNDPALINSADEIIHQST